MLLDIWQKTPTCEHCGETVDREDNYVVFAGVDGHLDGRKTGATERAVFHANTCAEEAKDYGWG